MPWRACCGRATGPCRCGAHCRTRRSGGSWRQRVRGVRRKGGSAGRSGGGWWGSLRMAPMGAVQGCRSSRRGASGRLGGWRRGGLRLLLPFLIPFLLFFVLHLLLLLLFAGRDGARRPLFSPSRVWQAHSLHLHSLTLTRRLAVVCSAARLAGWEARLVSWAVGQAVVAGRRAPWTTCSGVRRAGTFLAASRGRTGTRGRRATCSAATGVTMT